MAGSRFEVKRPARRRLPVLGAFVIAVGVSGYAFEHTSASPSLPMNGVLSAGHHAAPAKPASSGGSGGATSNVATAQLSSVSTASNTSSNGPTQQHPAHHPPPNQKFSCTWTDSKGHSHKFNDNDNGKYDQVDEPCDPNSGTSTEPPQKPLPPHSCTYTKTEGNGRVHTKIYHDHDPNNKTENANQQAKEPCEPSGDLQ